MDRDGIGWPWAERREVNAAVTGRPHVAGVCPAPRPHPHAPSQPSRAFGWPSAGVALPWARCPFSKGPGCALNASLWFGTETPAVAVRGSRTGLSASSRPSLVDSSGPQGLALRSRGPCLRVLGGFCLPGPEAGRAPHGVPSTWLRSGPCWRFAARTRRGAGRAADSWPEPGGDDVRTANLTVPSQLCPVSLLPSLPPSVSSCLSSASMGTFKIVFRKASLEAGPSTPGNVVRAAFSYGL